MERLLISVGGEGVKLERPERVIPEFEIIIITTTTIIIIIMIIIFIMIMITIIIVMITRF